MTQTDVTMTVQEVPKGWIKTNLADERYFEIVPSGISKFEGTKKYLSTSSIVGDKIVSVEDEISFEDRPSRANMEPIEGSVWFAKMKGTLKILCVDKIISQKYILSSGFCGIKPKANVSSRFLKQIFLSKKFNSVKDYLSTGSTQQGIGNGDLSKIIIFLPSLKEQEKIADILQNFDEGINETNKILSVCINLKKAELNKIYTKSSEMTITDLENCYNVIDCKHKTPKYVSEGIPVISPSEVNFEKLETKYAKKVSQVDYLDLCEKHTPKKGDIIFSRNASLGVASYIDSNEKLCIGQDTVIMTSEENNTAYLFFQLQSPHIQNQIGKIGAGSTFKRINLKDIKKLKIVTTNLSYQKRIADTFFMIDKRIAIEKENAKSLFSLKNSLMQKLLSGEIRVRV